MVPIFVRSLYLSVYLDVHGVESCQTSDSKPFIFHYSLPFVLCQQSVCRRPRLHHPVVFLHEVFVYLSFTSCVHNILTCCVDSKMYIVHTFFGMGGRGLRCFEFPIVMLVSSAPHGEFDSLHCSVWDHVSHPPCAIRVRPIQSLWILSHTVFW